MYDTDEHPRWYDYVLAGITAMLGAAVVIGIGMALYATAFGADVGQIPPNTPDNVRAWFKAVKSPIGVPCCDIADGHRTTWRSAPETEKNSGYEVPIGDEWYPVPKRAIVYNAGNPVGEAIVWYVDQGFYREEGAEREHHHYFVRCFVPDGGV